MLREGQPEEAALALLRARGPLEAAGLAEAPADTLATKTWLPDWLPKIGKGPECEPGTPSDLDLLVGTAGFEPATP